jgi:hypothetical protein
MESPIESQIWRLLQALEKLNGDADIIELAGMADDSLRRLVGTGIFGSLTGRPLALMQHVKGDPKMRESDHDVAKALLFAFDPKLNYAKLSNPEISVRTGFGVGKVRTSLKNLTAAGYFRSIPPSEREWNNGDHTLKYEPQFESLSNHDFVSETSTAI